MTPWTAALQASLSITNSWRLLKLMLVMPSNHLILCRPLLLPPSIFPSIRVFSNESVLRIRWPMYWSFSFSISPSSEYSGLISFRMDWLDLLAVQGTLLRVFFNTTLQKHLILPRLITIGTFNTEIFSPERLSSVQNSVVNDKHQVGSRALEFSHLSQLKLCTPWTATASSPLCLGL